MTPNPHSQAIQLFPEAQAQPVAEIMRHAQVTGRSPCRGQWLRVSQSVPRRCRELWVLLVLLVSDLPADPRLSPAHPSLLTLNTLSPA